MGEPIMRTLAFARCAHAQQVLLFPGQATIADTSPRANNA